MILMNRMFAHYSESAIEDSRPADSETDAEEWRARQGRLHRMMFREGARAALASKFDGLRDDALARLGWLSDVFGLGDIAALVAELEDRREKDQALTGTYGLTDGDLQSMVGEGFHTAFRKAVDTPEAVVIHKLISDMPSEEWGAIVGFVAGPIIQWLRDAEARAKGDDLDG